MLGFLLVTIIPTFLSSILLKRLGLHFRSIYLTIVFAWFTGIYLFTFTTFLLALLYVHISSTPLLHAVYTALLFWIIGLCFCLGSFQQILYHILHTKPKVQDIFFIAFCFLFSLVFFAPHLAQKDGMIYTSSIYWDFHWHAAVIQNFVLGNNFPPENETISGIPMTYHFFGYLLFAIYSAAGLTLVESLTWGSILIFSMLLLALIGTGEEITKSKWPGFFAVLLMITSSSAHFISYFSQRHTESLSQIITDIFKTTEHPWTLSFIPDSPENYSGILFNLFYLLEERHMIIGFVFLLFGFWILLKRHALGEKTLLFFGSLMGAYFLWHLYIAIMLLCALLFILCFDKKKRATLYLLAGFFIVFGLHYVIIKELIVHYPEFATDTGTYPQINFDFARILPNSNTFSDMISDRFYYYRFAYGLKLLLLPVACIVLWKKHRSLVLTLLAIIVPTFLLIHLIQLSPGEIGENHKWLRPMNLLIDVAVALALYQLFFIKKNFFKITGGIICLFFLTISGIIELMPFLNAKPTQPYAQYPSQLTQEILKYTPSKATFLGENTREILLAGRKIYIGDVSIGAEAAYNKTQRLQIMSFLYTTGDKKIFCNVARHNHIDFIEGSTQMRPLAPFPASFTTTDSTGNMVWFIDTKEQCNTL